MESIRYHMRRFFRTKTIRIENLRYRYVPRYQGLLHLLIQGLGNGTALGCYVLVTFAAKTLAGPTVVISALIVGVTSWIIGSSYSELACRLPLMGSSYLYSYVVFGELIAFHTGWNLILESCITTALTAQSLSHHLNVLLDGALERWIKEDLGRFPWDEENSPQVIASAFIILIAMTSVCRNKTLALTTQTLLFVLHLLIILAVLFLSLFHVDSRNWGSDSDFFRLGTNGIISGAAVLISGVSGLKNIAMNAEEIRKPSRNIPVSHTLTVMISSTLFFVLSALVTLSIPSENLSSRAPLLVMFESLKVKNSKYFIGVGCISGLVLALVTQMQYAERMIYSMARDQLLPRLFAQWNNRNTTPWSCRMSIALLSGLIAIFAPFDLLLQTISIASLMSYAITCMATIAARYDPCYIGLEKGNPLRKSVSAESFIMSRTNSLESDATDGSEVSVSATFQLRETAVLLTAEKSTSMTSFTVQKCPSPTGSSASDHSIGPDLETQRQINRALILSVIFSSCLGMILRFFIDSNSSWDWLPITLCLTLLFLIIICSLVVFRAPTNGMNLVYSAGGVPLLQILGIMMIIMMLFHLPAAAWIRYVVWSFAGFLIYFCYSRKHSVEAVSEVSEIFFENQAASNAL